MEFGYSTNGIDVVKHFPSEVKDRIFLITGPSTGGIGGETAISLAHGSPALIILIGRSLSKIQPVIDSIRAVDASVPVKFIQTDLTSLASIRRAADAILADPEIPRIDVMINNAAIMFAPFGLTEDGIEQQLATDHISHFLLTNLLIPKLLPAPVADSSAATPKRLVRVVNVSSSANQLGGVRFDDPNFTEPDSYTPLLGYGQGKTANVHFTVALNRRFASRADVDFHSYTLHPGSISTGLQKWMTPEILREATLAIMGKETTDWKVKTLQQGCSTQLRAALDPDLEKREGVFLSDCQLTTDSSVINPKAFDPEDAEKCWTMSEKLVHQEFRY